MRRIAYALLSSLLALPIAAQTVTVTANNILGINGQPLGQGYLCFTPGAANLTPQAFTSNGKQYYAEEKCWRVFAGAATGVTVPDTSMTSPAIGYMPVIRDVNKRPIQTYSEPFYPTALFSSFDTWQPSSAPLALGAGLISFGTNAPTGLCTAPSFGYLTDTTLYVCGTDSRWHVIAAGGGVTSSTIITALGYTPTSPTSLSGAIASVPAINSANIIAGLGYTPVSPSTLASTLASIPTVTSSNIITALGYTPTSPSALSSAIAAVLPSINSGTVTGALGYTPTSPSALSAAFTSSNVVGALGFTPANPASLSSQFLGLAGGTMSGTLTLNADPSSALQAATKQYVDNLVAGSIAAIAPATFSPVGGTYTSAQTITLTDATSGATISYCTSPTGNCTPNTVYSATLSVATTETICANALAGAGGVVSATSCNTYTISTGSPTGPTSTGIGTVLFQSYLTDGSLAYKTCYVGGSVCSGGVGSIAPSSTPTHTFGANTPSAGTGSANKVGNFHLETASTSGFTEALWTTTGGGVGANATPTTYYVGGWVKAVYAAGAWRIEMDPYAFDSGWDWMWGTQCNGDVKLIQTANQSSSWTSTSAPCGKLLDGAYHHVEILFHRTLAADRSCAGGTAPCATWDEIIIDGTAYALNVTMPATTSTWAGSGWQFQIDGKPTTASGGSPAVYDLWCDSCQFIAGTAASGGSPGGGGGTSSGTGDLDTFNFDGSGSAPSGLTAVGSPVISSSQSHTTTNSAHFPSGLNYYTDAISPVSQLYTRQYIYITTENAAMADSFLRFYHGGAELFVYYFSTSGTVSYFNQAVGGSGVTAASSPYPTAGWHYIETYTKISPTAGHVTVKMDGTQIYDSGSGTMNTGSSTIDTVWFGNIGSTAPTGWDTYEDNVDFDDTNWIGPI